MLAADNYHYRNDSTAGRKKTLSRRSAERVQPLATRLDAYYVRGLVTLGAFQQIKLDRLALVQSTIAVLLDSGEMHEDIFPG
jgi:hypothetical protein